MPQGKYYRTSRASVNRVMNYGDGFYGGMWLCGMYSAAFFESDIRQVIEAGLASIPAGSPYAPPMKLNRSCIAEVRSA